MACERHVDALTALALGGPLEPEVAAHLAVCSACQAWLAGEQSVAAAVDHALALVARVEPEGDFHVRLRMTAERAAPVMRHAWWWSAAAVAAAILTLVVVRVPPTDSLPAAATVSIPTTPALPPSVPSDVAAATAPHDRAPVVRVARAARDRRSTATPPEPHVLVPAGQAEAIVRLFGNLPADSGPVGLAASPAPVGQAPGVGDIDRIVVPPIVIEALVVPRPLLLAPEPQK
ncbi:MAG: hypothetical protein U0Q12_14410 [Vicinamibacterales bacterium]